ncbi:MAG: hypothetical protein ACYC9Y_11760 [Candidatus Methylomirabilia bacterium]
MPAGITLTLMHRSHILTGEFLPVFFEVVRTVKAEGVFQSWGKGGEEFAAQLQVCSDLIVGEGF